MDFNGNILASNETTAARLGKQVEEIIGTNTYATYSAGRLPKPEKSN